MKKIYTIFYLLLLFLPSVLAQTAMDLRECLRIGLENNYGLRITRNEERISGNNVTLGNAGFLPEVSLSSGYALRNANSDQFPADGSQTVATRNANTGTLDAAINLNWTIFEGFRAQTSYKRLRELQTIGELNTRLAVENLAANIAAEYYNYVQQQIRTGNLRHAVELSRERLRIVEARYQVGSLSRLDLQQARVDFNADSSTLIRQYEALHASRIMLNELMGADVEQLFVPADSTISLIRMRHKDALLESVMQSNVSLLLAEKNKTMGELDLRIQQSRNYPYLRLNGGYGFTHNDYSRGTWNRQRTWGPNVGLTLGYTLFDGFNRNREQRNARIVVENRALEIEQRKLALQSDFANMWMAYQNNIELTNLEYESLENAKLNHEIAMERYRIGDLSGLELREAQNSLLNAEERLLTARYRTKLYEISLMQISGLAGEYL